MVILFFKGKEEEKMKPVQILILEHKTIEKMIDILRFFSQDIKRIEKTSLETYEKIIDFFRFYVDYTHHGKEEKILFKKLNKKKHFS